MSKHLNPITFGNLEWKVIKLEKRIQSNDEYIFIGFNNPDNSPVYIDDISIKVKNAGLGDSSIFEYNFDTDSNDLLSINFNTNKNQPFNLQVVAKKENRDSCLLIEFNNQIKLFDEIPEVGVPISEQIHPNLIISLPVMVMANESHTFPIANYQSLKSLKLKLGESISEEYKNLGSLVIAWNVIEHFFPYFDEIEVDWENEFENAIFDIYKGNDFRKTLQRFSAKLKDGHVSVIPPTQSRLEVLPIEWEWIGEELVITKVHDQSLTLSPGAIVEKIEGQNATKYFSEIEQYIPAPTLGFLHYHSQNSSLFGTPGDSISVSIKSIDGTKDKVSLFYSMDPQDHFQKSYNKTKFKILENNIYYLNLDQISMPEIDSMIPELENSNGIICDLRGYPKSNSDILSHLLSENDTVDNWMKIPLRIYPNRNRIVGYSTKGWQISSKQLQIKAPVVFITDGRAISYAESVLLLVKHYHLATIVGQPSAGTDGNINIIKFPNGFQLIFTGMKVTNLNGSQHFGIGVLPDVYVEKTITGVTEGRDEFLIKAVDILNKGL